MTVDTMVGVQIDYEMIQKYFKNLVNQFFKILPMREKEEESLPTYIESLQCEVIGCGDVISYLNNDPSFMSLLGILQYLKVKELTVKQVRREVFKAISICNRLSSEYSVDYLNGGDKDE